MATSVLNPTQQYLLKLFSYNNSEEYAREVQAVLTKHFQQELDAESDKLWDDGVLDAKRLEKLRYTDFHK
ncbi:hypothetical protein [Prevotella sp. CAG:592]|uniref:hypothetical protein n=1 Tax=Prevotella sp. CAG:592 TaxID=1262931 RepID=UPI0003401BBB|nr:hypothetical protein [Prevotella sp. CAG:592]CDD06163.1 putative uncharacterized protein [Prevotella sp. CAG:592]